ncbi:MAG TPA: tRNA lysidine(34) synthetase TilS [Vicinamibacteria bacterium]|nr:tRNA lysidine(34) synthetase TilS [Vicinamibacteria bacterium]
MFSSKVIRTLERYRMVLPGDSVLIALSGGADSVALTGVLFELRHRLGLSLFLAHLNHGLRAEADDDEAFCRSLSERLSLPFASEKVDVAASARRSKRSLEDEGRRARYRFLESQAKRFEANRIAVGHTLDDQAETFLLRLLRGSGGRGLAAIHPVKDGRIIRPLLESRRAEIVTFLEERGLPFREDRSNADPRFTRNRIRHDELPRLSAVYNPRLTESLARTACLLREDEAWMGAETEVAFAAIASLAGDEVELARQGLLERPLALQRRLVRAAIERVRGLEGVSHRHVEDVLTLAQGQSGRELHLPGLLVERSFDRLRFREREKARARKAGERSYNGFEYRLSIPARVRIPECSGTLSARIAAIRRKPDEPLHPSQGNAVVLGFGSGLPELSVRSPRPGDRFHPLGAPGSKPLSRYLMDRKISREARRRVPLVVRAAAPQDSGEEILWVVGHGVSEASRVSEAPDSASRLVLRWDAS